MSGFVCERGPVFLTYAQPHRLGYIFRIVFAQKPYDNLTMYILTTLFVLLSPCAFLAVNYSEPRVSLSLSVLR